MMWLISCSVAFSDILTIMGLGSPYKLRVKKQRPRSPDRGCWKLVRLGDLSGSSLPKLLRSRYPDKSVAGGKSKAWSKSRHRIVCTHIERGQNTGVVTGASSPHWRMRYSH